MVKKARASAIQKRRGHASRKKIGRNSEGKAALVEKDFQKQVEKDEDWSPREAYLRIVKDRPGATADFLSGLPSFIVECKKMFPGMTFGELQNKVANGYGVLW